MILPEKDYFSRDGVRFQKVRLEKGRRTAGNDLLIVTDYDTAYREIKTGVLDKEVSEDLINQATLKILAWKYYKGLLMENEK